MKTCQSRSVTRVLIATDSRGDRCRVKSSPRMPSFEAFLFCGIYSALSYAKIKASWPVLGLGSQLIASLAELEARVLSCRKCTVASISDVFGVSYVVMQLFTVLLLFMCACAVLDVLPAGSK